MPGSGLLVFKDGIFLVDLGCSGIVGKGFVLDTGFEIDIGFVEEKGFGISVVEINFFGASFTI